MPPVVTNRDEDVTRIIDGRKVYLDQVDSFIEVDSGSATQSEYVGLLFDSVDIPGSMLTNETRKTLKPTTAMDKSRKQSYDEQINDLIEYLNRNSKFETTSSCSGRIIIYQLESTQNLSESPANVKYEPFILHCRAFDLDSAKKLHHVAVSSGYRESGISISNKGKIMVAVRSSQNMDIPIANGSGKLMVTEEYMRFISEILNEKMAENATRRERFFKSVKEMFPEDVLTTESQSDNTGSINS